MLMKIGANSSVQFSCSVVSDCSWSHRLQHARPLCPSPTPRVYSHSCPLSWWCHPTISSSVICFSFHLQSFPESGAFPVSQFFASGGQSIGASVSASVLPMNIQDWFPLGWTGWISLQSKGLSRVLSSIKVKKHQFFSAQTSLWSNSYIRCIQLNQSLKVFCPKPANELQNSEYVFFIDFLLLFSYFCDLAGAVTISPSENVVHISPWSPHPLLRP